MLKLTNLQSSVGQKRVGLEVSEAIAHAVKLANVDVVAVYPIKPQTHIIESIATMVASGELHAAYIPVESEHSAMSACLGAAATGARAFTASASQGLELMHEVLYAVSGTRLPVVMVYQIKQTYCNLDQAYLFTTRKNYTKFLLNIASRM